MGTHMRSACYMHMCIHACTGACILAYAYAHMHAHSYAALLLLAADESTAALAALLHELSAEPQDDELRHAEGGTHGDQGLKARGDQDGASPWVESAFVSKGHAVAGRLVGQASPGDGGPTSTAAGDGDSLPTSTGHVIAPAATGHDPVPTATGQDLTRAASAAPGPGPVASPRAAVQTCANYHPHPHPHQPMAAVPAAAPPATTRSSPPSRFALDVSGYSWLLRALLSNCGTCKPTAVRLCLNLCLPVGSPPLRLLPEEMSDDELVQQGVGATSRG